MTDEEFADLVNEKQRLKWRLRNLTKDIELIQQILDRLDDIDEQLGA